MNYKFFKEYDQLELLQKVYSEMLDQIHVKDGKKSLSGSLLGEGEMEFQKQIDFLTKANYSGWIIIENYYDQKPLRLQSETDQLSLLIRDLVTLKKALGCK
jgi:sugar phosphate isomerase/epimerase